ncbi:hect-domain (ubiquitin-transferase) domain-containing protein [Cystoisospora suis]|uniref:Hect-domain (Ubiquitin-transferase) domain-containing protein n=1 Tax=Cystoisospora suis TaxID=483139 RepID=A0A2C6LAZ2_9APIC|nr:hect-domain (ubiquitin-transferase) domain-containing protein [Cystoisospora suis]
MVDGQTQMAKLEACVMRREIAKSSSSHLAHLPKGRRSMVEREEKAQQEAAAEASRAQRGVTESNDAGVRRKTVRQGATSAAEGAAEENKQDKEDDDTGVRREASVKKEAKKEKLQGEGKKRGSVKQERDRDDQRSMSCVDVAEEGKETRVGGEGQGRAVNGRQTKEEHRGFKVREQKQEREKAMSREEKRKRVENEQAQRSRDDHKGVGRGSRRSARLCAHVGERRKAQGKEDENGKASMAGSVLAKETAADVRRREASLYACPDSRASQQRACERRFLWEEAIDGSHQGAEKMKEEEQDVDLLTGVKEVRHEDHGRGRRRGRQRRVEAGDKTADDDSEPPQEVVNDSRLRERGDEEEPGTDEDGVTSPSSSPSCSPEELDEEEEDSEMGGVEVRIGSPPVSSSREAHHITGSSSESRENGTFSWGNAHTSFLTPPGQQLVNGGWRLGSLSVSPITSEVQLFLNTVPVPSHMPLIEALCRYSHCLPVTAGTAERCVSISTPHFSSHVSSSSSFSYPQRARRFSGTAGRQGEGSEGWSARDLTVRRAPSSSCSLGNRRRRALCECEEAEFRRKEAPRSTLGERHSSAAARSCPSSDNTSGETRGMFSLGRSAVEGLEGGRSGGNPAFFRSSSFVVGSRSPCPPPFEDQYAVVDLSARFLVALDNDIAMLPQRSKGGRRCNWDSLSQGTSQLRRPVSAEGASIWFSRGGHTNGWDLLEKSPGEPGGDTSDGGGGGGVKTVSRPSLSVASPARRNRRSITEETERMILHNGEGPEGDILGFRPVWDVRHSLEYKILRLPPHLQKINNGSGAHLSGTPRGQVPEGRGVFVSCTERAAPRDLVVSSPSLSSSSNGEELEEEQSYLLEGRHSPLLCSVVDPIFGSRNLRRDFLSFVGTRASSHTSPSVCSGSSPLSGQFFSPVLSRPPLPKESGKSDSFGSVGQQDEENNAVTPRPLPPPPNVPAVANQPLRFNQHPESQSPLRRTSCFYTTDATGEAQSPLKRKGDCVFLNRTQTDSLVSSGQANAARLLAAFEEARDRMRFLRGCVSIPSRRDLIWCAGSDEAASLVVRRRSCQPRRVENGEAMRERGSGSCSSLLCPSRSSECDSLPQFSALSGSLGSGAEEREEANGVHVSRGRAENQAQTFRERKVSVVREVALSQKSGQGTASVSPRALNMCRITNNCRSTRSPRPEESVNEKQEEVDGQGYFPFLPDMFTRDRTSSALIFLLLLLHHLIQALRRLQLEGAFVSHSDDSAALAVELTSASPLPSSVAVSKEEERKGGKDPTTASAAGFLFHPDTHSPVSRRFLLHRVSEAQLSTLFTSSALSFKVFQVLADPIRVPSMSPPLWMSRLLKACPFLFPFSARMQFVTHTSLGLSRAICCYSSRVREAAETVLRGGNGTSTGVTQVGNSASGGGSRMVSSAVAGGGGTAGGVGGLQGAGSDTTSRALMTALMGRVFAQSKSSRRQQQDFIADLETAALLPRTKVKIYRTKCIDSAFKVMEHFHSLLYSGGGGGASGYQQQPLLEVEYFGEEGVGSGPTIEFYSEVLEALQTHTAPRLFRDSGSDGCFFPFPHMTDASCLGPSFFRKPSMSPLASSSSSGSAVSPSPSEFLSSSLPPGGHLSSGSAYARASPRSGVSKTEDSRKRSPASVSSPRKQTSSLPGRIEESVRTENPVGAARQPVGDQVTDDGERIDGEELSASSAKGGNRAEARSLSEDLNSSKREQKLRLRSAVMEEGGDVTVGDGRKDRRKLAEDSEETAVGSADGGVHPSDRESVVGGRRTDTTNASTLNRSESSHREVHDDELKKPSAGVSSSALVSAASCLEQKLFLLFKLLGQLAAKALLDGRSHCIDLRLHPSFWRLVLQSETHNCRCLWRGLRRRCLAGQEKFKRTERGEKRRTGAEEKSSISSDQLHQDEYRASHRGCRRFSAYDNGTDDNAGACHSPSVEGTAVRRDRAAAEEAWKSVGEARMQTREKEDGQVPADGVGQAQGNEFCTACLRLRALGLVDLVEVDEQLARGLQHMLKMRSEGSDISQLACVFVLPGTDIELVDNGEDVIVDNTNLDLYIQRVLQVTLYEGVLLQAYAFRFGFSTFVPLSALSQFSPVENAHQLYGSGGRLGDPRFWNLDHLRAHIVPDHGPLMKVVRKPACEAGSRDGRDHFSSSSPSSSSADSVLPSVMTCTNYIKLPEYSTKSMLRARLVTAMTEGQGAFTLS